MKFLKLVLISTFFISFSVQSNSSYEDCDATPTAATELLRTMKAVSDGLYKDIATLKVNHDGQGKLSIFYENGVPVALRMTYKNDAGEVINEKTFADIDGGRPLHYISKDKDYPGKAIILEKGPTFKNGSKYGLILKIRSSVRPEEYRSYSIEFESDMSAPKLSSEGRNFKHIEITPGIGLFNWNGTFKAVQFK